MSFKYYLMNAGVSCTRTSAVVFLRSDRSSIFIIIWLPNRYIGCYTWYVLITFDSCLFVCLFVCLFIIPLEKFSLIWRQSLPVKTYTQHLWSVSSEGSFACHTFCNSGHLYIMVISEDSLAVAVLLPASTT